MKQRTASYRYDHFSEVIPGVEIPLEHRGSLYAPGRTPTLESVRVDAFVGNQPVAASLFDAATFMGSDIEFVADFAKIYEE